MFGDAFANFAVELRGSSRGERINRDEPTQCDCAVAANKHWKSTDDGAVDENQTLLHERSTSFTDLTAEDIHRGFALGSAVFIESDVHHLLSGFEQRKLGCAFDDVNHCTTENEQGQE